MVQTPLKGRSLHHNGAHMITVKFQTLVACQKGLDNSVGPDQTASEEAVRSGPSLFAIMTSILLIPALITKI